MISYTETDYPEKTFTIADADVRESGGACPFQATGTVGGESFYFRIRHGSASLEVGSHYRESLNANIARWDYADGAIDYSTFEEMFTELIASYRPKKTPVGYPGYSSLSFSDAVIDYRTEHMISGTIDDETFTLEIDGSTITLDIDYGRYVREIELYYGEYNDMYIFDSEAPIEEIFNRLIADLR